jgi:hypothetical protein
MSRRSVNGAFGGGRGHGRVDGIEKLVQAGQLLPSHGPEDLAEYLIARCPAAGQGLGPFRGEGDELGAAVIGGRRRSTSPSRSSASTDWLTDRGRARVPLPAMIAAEGRGRRGPSAPGPATVGTVLGYPDVAFATRGRGERSATARDVNGHARPFESAFWACHEEVVEPCSSRAASSGLTGFSQAYGSAIGAPGARGADGATRSLTAGLLSSAVP